ncbi:MAG: UDP-2,3-diacylglucosamine diphosphatase [Bacteriovoracaceae bacterium]
MKISAISDVHVKYPHDEADRLLMSFLNHPEVQSSDYVLLLGDIFDLMCGPHRQYLEKFEHIWTSIDDLIRSGRKVFFFEGNHDVHLEKLFKKYWPNGEVVAKQEPVIQEIEGKLYYFSHGDEHEIDNTSYQNYKRLILSGPLKFVANHLMPYQVLHMIGERASKRSRKKGSKLFDAEKVKFRFRDGVSKTTDGKFHFILGGHSHVQDLHHVGVDSIYINNGYALKTKTFILITDHQVSFEKLT